MYLLWVYILAPWIFAQPDETVVDPKKQKKMERKMKRAGMMWKIKKTNLLYPRSRIFMTKTRHSVQGIVPSRIQVYSWTLKDRACIKWQKFYQVLRAKLPQHSHFTIVSGQTLLAQKKSDHLGKQEIKLLVISLIYSRIFFLIGYFWAFEPLPTMRFSLFSI